MPALRTLLASPALALLLALFLTQPAAANTPLDRIVAVVNNDVILQSEVDEAIDEARSQLIARGIGVPPIDVLRDQVMERLVVTRLQMQRALQAGIRVDDRELNEVIRNIARQNNMTVQQFAEQIENEGLEFGYVREKIREEVMITRLKQREVDSRVVVTKQDVDLLLDRQGVDPEAEYHLAHILIALPDGATPDERAAARDEAQSVLAQARDGAPFAELAVEHSDGQQALTGGDLDWRSASDMPEAFAQAAAGLAPGEVSDIISTTGGFHLIKLIESRGGAPRETVVEAKARHILIQPDAIMSEDAARAQARELYDRIQNGADFAELAREYSDDAGSRNSGGDLGWSPPGALVADFQAQLDALQPGEVSEPFRTQFGWHIAQLEDRRTRDTTDEARRARARSAIFQRKAEEEYDLWLRRLRDEAYVEYRTGNPATDGRADS